MLEPKLVNVNGTDATTNGEVHDVKPEGPESTSLSIDSALSLRLEKDALIVVDESSNKRDQSSLWNRLASRPSHDTKLTIPLSHVLWASLSSSSNLTIAYAAPAGTDIVRATTIRYTVGAAQLHSASTFATRLLSAAYGPSQPHKRIKAIVNPVGGRSRAGKWWSKSILPIFAAARCAVDMEVTRHQGHGIEIVEELDVDRYDVVACCSGDGVPHEVFNGLGRRKDAVRALRKIAVVQLPCGSGNAMAWNLCGTGSPSLAALRVVKGLRTPLDLVSVTHGGRGGGGGGGGGGAEGGDRRRTLSFLSQALGTVAETDLGTENLRWMGDARFTYGMLVKILLGKAVYPCDVAVKLEMGDKAEIRARYQQERRRNHPPTTSSNVDGEDGGDMTTFQASPPNNGSGSDADGQVSEGGLPPLRYGYATDALPEGWSLVPYDNLGSLYVGNMAYVREDGNIFPAALPSDGCIDLICIDGDLSRSSSLQIMMAVANNRIFDDHRVTYRKVSAYRIVPKGQADGSISVDGERIPFGPFQAEVHRGLGTVLSMSGRVYEAPGVGEMMS
ncbi:MAG: sphinganine kinase lcb4 [Peltula sp. TS41687]|nr:MAG: sphinganine kinase lcb4 [Peltula sp. TS41687]